MTPRLVIFDCDGVLVDTETTTNRIIANNLSRHGLPISPDECHALFSGGTMQSAGEEARKRGADLPETWLDDIYTEVFDGLALGVEVIPGIPEVLDILEKHGIAMAIASNGPPRKMEITLKPSGLHARFKGRIYSRVTHGPPKPDPSMLLHACRDAGIPAADHPRIAPYADALLSDMRGLHSLLGL